MPELVDMNIGEVSGVDKAANGRKFIIMKRDEDHEPEDVNKGDTEGVEIDPENVGKKGGFFAKIAEGLLNMVTKGDAVDFSQAVAESQLTDRFWIATDALRKAIRTTMQDKDLTADQKATNITNSLDQFKTFVMQLSGLALGGTVAVQKKGAKISAARAEQLKAARAAIDAVLNDTEVADQGGNIKKEGDIDMTPEQLQDVITKALEPVTKRLDTLEKGDNQPENKPESKPEGDIAKSVEAAITKALEPVSKRLDTLEQAKGIKKSVDGQETPSEPVQKSFWSGLL